MYKYEEPSLFSGRRGAAFIAVIILHVVIVWAFYTGLAGKLVQKIIPPVEIAQIDKPKEVDKPPPPPPKLEEIKPYVPPPEFVDIQAPPAETNAITADDAGAATAAAGGRAAPRSSPARPITMDPKHPLKIGEEYYPDASKRANEEGRCIVHDHGGRRRQDHQRVHSDELGLSAPGRSLFEGRAWPAHDAGHRGWQAGREDGIAFRSSGSSRASSRRRYESHLSSLITKLNLM